MSKLYNFSDQELSMSVQDIGLSTRATHALLWQNIKTLNDLIRAVETTDLKKFHYIGKTTVNEIMNKLEEMRTPKWRDANARNREFAQKTKEIKEEIAKHYAEIEKLNNYLRRIEEIKQAKETNTQGE